MKEIRKTYISMIIKSMINAPMRSPTLATGYLITTFWVVRTDMVCIELKFAYSSGTNGSLSCKL